MGYKVGGGHKENEGNGKNERKQNAAIGHVSESMTRPTRNDKASAKAGAKVQQLPGRTSCGGPTHKGANK